MIGGGMGRWSVPIGDLFGTHVRVHWTFLLLLLYVGFTAADGLRGAVVGLAFTVGLIASLVVHEAAHGVGARLFGSSTSEVVLYPIGGVARLSRGLTPPAEVVVAAAGPLAQLGIVVGLALTVHVGPDLVPEANATLFADDGLTALLLAANAIVLFANLAPVWPLDGGRLVRAVLAIMFGADKAPLAGARVGQAFGLAVALAGILAPPLVLLGGVLFLGSTQDVAAIRRARSLRHLSVADAMVRRFEVVPPHESLGRAGERLLGSPQRAFPVVDGWGRLSGLLTRNALLAALDRLGPDATVGDAMSVEVRVVDAATPLDRAAEALALESSGALVVMHEGRIAGLMTAERLAEVASVGGQIERRTEG
jgi:stage IV sporulation protein FB